MTEYLMMEGKTDETDETDAATSDHNRKKAPKIDGKPLLLVAPNSVLTSARAIPFG